LQLPRRRVDDMQDVRAYVLGMVRNEVRAALRSVRRRPLVGARVQAQAAAPRRDATGHDLADAIEALTPPLREVVVLKHVAGLTFDQMALATGENRNTLAARYRRALQDLRERWRATETRTEISHAG
ncbi:MAG: RNA polymerase sigma factor, partial [Phycisphaerales bacterium JB038]